MGDKVSKSKDMSFGILDSINKKPISNDKNISTNNDSANSNDNDSSNNNSSNISNNVDNNISIDNDRNVDRNVSNSNDRNIIGNIVIKKPITSDKPKRVSYYLKEKTISDIEKSAKKSGMGISEFLQYFLELTLDKIEIR